jgi:antitoxin (DNA-binding transcriptional repressor) of toxin-antitoxin stability system
MTRKLTQRELRSKTGEVMHGLDDGEDFVITRDGKPVGELLPIQRHKRKFIPKEELLALFEGAPHIDYEQFRADIDAFVDQDPTPRY